VANGTKSRAFDRRRRTADSNLLSADWLHAADVDHCRSVRSRDARCRGRRSALVL